MEQLTTLLAIIMLTAGYAKGQTQKEIEQVKKMMSKGQNITGFITLNADTTRDTIPVLMLVSDTSKQHSNGLELNSYLTLSPPLLGLQPTVIKGYKAVVIIKDGIFWADIIYLDLEKQPLSKNIIVWESVPAK